MFGVFRVKNHDFAQKNHIFSNFREGARRVPPPLDPPLTMASQLTQLYPFCAIKICLRNYSIIVFKMIDDHIMHMASSAVP